MSMSDTGSTADTQNYGTSTSALPASGTSGSTASTSGASTGGTSGSGAGTAGGSAGPSTAVRVTAVAPGGCKTRGWIFFYNIAWVLGLCVVGILYFRQQSSFPSLEFLKFDSEKINIAVRCMWFGSLGGVVISLKGVYDHHCNRGDWDDGFFLWHLGRPVSGALTGLITLVLLLAINPSDPNEPVAYAIAFIFGTQERRFFNFLAEVAALVVRVPGDDQDGTLKALSLTPQEGKEDTFVFIGGQGFREGAMVTFGANEMKDPVVSKDGRIIGGKAPAGAPGSAVDVTVINPDKKRVLLVDKFTYTN